MADMCTTLFLGYLTLPRSSLQLWLKILLYKFIRLQMVLAASESAFFQTFLMPLLKMVQIKTSLEATTTIPEGKNYIPRQKFQYFWGISNFFCLKLCVSGKKAIIIFKYLWSEYKCVNVFIIKDKVVDPYCCLPFFLSIWTLLNGYRFPTTNVFFTRTK